MSSSAPDMNIKNWSIEDIMQLLEVDELDPTEITAVSDRLIDKAITDDNSAVVSFLKQARDKLLENISRTEELGSFGQQATPALINWWQNQYLTQDNPTQADKATTRQNHVQTFDNSHYQMKRETLGINQTYDVGVAQGSINPNLKNIVERTIVIDSQYRPNILPFSDKDTSAPSFGSSFTANLSDPLQNVLSLELYSVQIPKTWYTITSFIGNNCYAFAVSADEDPATWNTVTDGSYSPSDVTGTSPNSIILGVDISFNSITNRVGIKKNSSKDFIIWFKGNSLSLQTQCEGCSKTVFPNNNLGWTLGFRTWDEETKTLYTDLSSGNWVWADAAPQLAGPQYLLLTLDDFNHNRLNKGIISTTQGQTKLDLPSYYNPVTQTCDASGQVFATKSAPRQLTQAQLYTINTIYQDRKVQKNRPNAPTSNNVLAIIPVPNDVHYGRTIVLYGNDLASNSRDYFGPVTIERIKASLRDDKGNVVDLNGADWSFTFRIKQLYQY